MGESITFIWNTFFFQPLLNGVILLYGVLFHNFGLTVIVFTIIVRIIILPLTLRQLHAARSMSRLQPELSKLQKKYGNDRQRMSQEQMRLYKEQGVNPLGCAIPTLVQFPVWIGLYQSILLALATTPESLIRLSAHLYPGLSQLHELVPLNSGFLWLDLADRDPFFVLPILVASSMWIQQKMATMHTDDPRQQQMNAMMQWMMPVMFGYFTVLFASGLALYWLVSNVISVVVQYRVTGWGSLPGSVPWLSKPTEALPAPDNGQEEAQVVEASTAISTKSEKVEKRRVDGKSRNKRKVGRRGR